MQKFFSASRPEQEEGCKMTRVKRVTLALVQAMDVVLQGCVGAPASVSKEFGHHLKHSLSFCHISLHLEVLR